MNPLDVLHAIDREKIGEAAKNDPQGAVHLATSLAVIRFVQLLMEREYHAPTLSVACAALAMRLRAPVGGASVAAAPEQPREGAEA